MTETKEKKTRTTDIRIDSENYIQFTQELADPSQQLDEVTFKFDGDIVILSREQIVPFFAFIEKIKQEMARL